MSELSITGVVLAGGLARRMEGADKGLIFFKGAPLVKYAIVTLIPALTGRWNQGCRYLVKDFGTSQSTKIDSPTRQPLLPRLAVDVNIVVAKS